MQIPIGFGPLPIFHNFEGKIPFWGSQLCVRLLLRCQKAHMNAPVALKGRRKCLTDAPHTLPAKLSIDDCSVTASMVDEL